MDWPISQRVSNLDTSSARQASQLVASFSAKVSTVADHDGVLVSAASELELERAVAAIRAGLPHSRAHKPQLNYPPGEEPYCVVTVSVPAAFAERVRSDLASRRAHSISESPVEGSVRLQAEVPFSELLGYATSLRSMSQASGTFEQSFIGYQSLRTYGGPAA
jgi:translation elongation factor EF-G